MADLQKRRVWKFARAVCLISLTGSLLFLMMAESPVWSAIAPFDLVDVDWAAAISTQKSLNGNNLEALRSVKAVASRLARRNATPGLGDSENRDLTTINAASSILHPKIAAAGSPVLLPLDFAAFARDLQSVDGTHATQAYLGRLKSLAFYPGPYGYRAYFQLKNTSTIMVSGSTILYRLSGAPKVPTLDSCTSMIVAARKNGDTGDFFKYLDKYEDRIGQKKAEYFSEREATVPCLFAGALIEINILCDAYGDPDCSVRDLAKELFASLNFVGGAPRPKGRPTVNDPIQRLADEVAGLENAALAAGRKNVPQYSPPGELVKNSGVKGAAGSHDLGVYGPILFPTDLSAVAQTVIYRSDEHCLVGDDTENGMTCVTKSGLIIEKATIGQWRDNFCEARSGNSLPTCPNSSGHAGQDIWGQDWNESSVQHPLRAVVDGIAFRRFPAQPAVTVSDVNGTNIDYIYRHMRPSALGKNGIKVSMILSVARGCTLAFADRLQGLSKDKKSIEDGGHFYEETARHLHFEIRVPTNAGFQNVSPYQTLVQAHRAAVTKVDTSPASTKSCVAGR
jgi:hypothetical protein